MSNRIRLYCLFAITSCAAWAIDPAKLARDLPVTGGHVDVIVQYHTDVSPAALAAVAARGGVLRSAIADLRAISYRMPASAAASLSDDPSVRYISPDRPISAQVDITAQTAGAYLAHSSGYTGDGVTVAVLDSGVQEHPDLRGAVVYKESVVPGRSVSDGFGHGTHVAGIIAGSGGSSDGRYRGLAPRVKLAIFRVLDDGGRGSDSTVIAAIDRVIRLKGLLNIRVLNLSLGRPVVESHSMDPLCEAVRRAWQAGIAVVVAAGNGGRNDRWGTGGYGTILSPGNSPYVITVGAMNAKATPGRGDDVMTSYSSKGPTAIDHVLKPDLVAPGNLVVALGGKTPTKLALTYPANVVSPGNYFRLSGSSVAAPSVSAAIALLLDKFPALTPDQVKARLMKTATKDFPTSSVLVDRQSGETYVVHYDAFTVGAGYLDIMAALNSHELAAGRALSPTVIQNRRSGTVEMVLSSGVCWGSGVTWGTGVIWGSGSVSGAGVVWGSGVVWGTGNPYATGLIWGTGVVWGTAAPIASAVLAGGDR